MKWFRFYHDALDDPKVQRLPGDLYKFWVNMLCLGSRSKERGLVQMSVSEIAFDVRLDESDAEHMMAELIERGLVEDAAEGFQIHNWDARQFKSDNVSERVGKHRDGKKSEDVTLHETLQVTPDVTLEPSVYTDSQSYRVTEGQNGSGADAPNTPEPSKTKPASKKASRIPENFAISDRDREWAFEKGIRALEIEQETEKFVNYWTAESGARASKLDWHAAWKVWISRNAPPGGKPGGLTIHQGGRGRANDVDAIAAANKAARERAKRIAAGGNPPPLDIDDDVIETHGRIA